MPGTEEILAQRIVHVTASFVHEGGQQKMSTVLNRWNSHEDDSAERPSFMRHKILLIRRQLHQTPITLTNSFTAAALLSRPAFSSAVSFISMICSMPFTPSFTGTPTYRPLIPYSPWR